MVVDFEKDARFAVAAIVAEKKRRIGHDRKVVSADTNLLPPFVLPGPFRQIDLPACGSNREYCIHGADHQRMHEGTAPEPAVVSIPVAGEIEEVGAILSERPHVFRTTAVATAFDEAIQILPWGCDAPCRPGQQP